jgi:hypothetical protein
MEVARDLQDHQLVDRDDRPCGRVDDVVIAWDASDARVGALLSGLGVLLDQIGLAGRIAKRLPIRAAHSHVAIEWRQVRELQPHHVCLLPAQGALGLRHAGTPGSAEGELLLTALLERRVIDDAEHEMGILDVRISPPRPPQAPRVMGLLCAPQPKLLLLGLKRHDGGLLPRPRIGAQARFVPWEAVAEIGQVIRLSQAFADLPLLADTPDEDMTSSSQAST